MEPETRYGVYYRIETKFGSCIVPAEVVGLEATAEELVPYCSEAIGAMTDPSTWSIETATGWYGRLTMPGYLDCSDWESADSEDELLESLQPDDDEFDPFATDCD